MKVVSAGLSTLAIMLLCGATTVAQDRHQTAEHVELPQQAVAVLIPTEGNDVKGVVMFTQQEGSTHVQGKVINLTPGKHGFHIHEFGDLRDPQGQSAGGHFNPTGAPHGAPDDPQRHVGDLGNIEANQEGVATIDMKVDGLMVHFILGRGLVVHAGEDDLTSQPSGDAGGRAAVGVIGVAQTDEAASASSSSKAKSEPKKKKKKKAN